MKYNIRLMAIVFLVCVPYLVGQSVITWTRTDFEAGVTYDPASVSIGTVNNPCKSNNFSNQMKWGDGAVDFLSSSAKGHTDGSNGYVVDAGLYTLPASHVFAAAGSYNASLTATVQCVGTAAVSRIDHPTVFTVYPRTPIHEMTTNLPQIKQVPQLKRGGQATVKIILTDIAPKSNTRVNLSWTGDAAFKAAQVSFIDVPATLNSVDLPVVTTKMTAVQDVALAATTLGTPAKMTIHITP
ncbi:MAG TPA: hypothetical protein VGQ49_05580 [Bryobacteraceae bacterium]|jgi:hypothetical protein|nr:hypothetical protein [Bryobacteraceae bacterium]